MFYVLIIAGQVSQPIHLIQMHQCCKKSTTTQIKIALTRVGYIVLVQSSHEHLAASSSNPGYYKSIKYTSKQMKRVQTQ